MRFGIRRGSLRTKIIAWSFIPTMIIMIAVAVFIFDSYDNVTEELVIEQNRDVARLTSRQLEAELDQYSKILDIEARTPELQSADPDLQRDALKGAANRLAVFDGGTLLLDTFGMVVAAEPERLEILGQDWSGHSYYRQILRLEMQGSSDAVFSEIVADGIDGEDVLCVAVPVTGEYGEFLGSIVGMFRTGATSVSSFYGDLVKLHLGEDGDAYLVDGNGQVIYHTDSKLIASDFSSNIVVQKVLDGQSDCIRTKGADGHSLVASYAPVPGTSWGLVMQESWNSLISSGRGYRNILLLLISLGIIVPIIIITIGVRQITKPVAMVSHAAEEIAAGNFDQEIVIDTGDELEEMADHFNSMSKALKDSYATLEQRVADRTAGERRRVEHLRAINEVGRKISSILDLDELLSFVVKSLQETFGYYYVGIILIDRNSDKLILRASAGSYGGGPEIGSEVTRGSGIISSVTESGEPLMVNDVLSHPLYRHMDALADTKSEIATPIIVGDRLVGVLDIEANQVDAFDELDLFTAQTLADQIAIAIENARLYEQAHELATVEERQRLARDLHDAVTQTLFSASLIAEVLPILWDKNPEEGKRRLEELRRSTKGALAEMRILLLELRPAALTEVDLAELLHQMTDAATGKSGIPVILNVEGHGSLPADVQVVFYRIAQEALNNIQKHAEATEVTVNLGYSSDFVELVIKDNGVGFDPAVVSAEHLGLNIICERAEAIEAECVIESEIERGTQVKVVWKVPPQEDEL